jgi:hypothetical protein
MAAFRRPGEPPFFGDREEILQPNQVHDTISSSNDANTALARGARLVQCNRRLKSASSRLS